MKVSVIVPVYNVEKYLEKCLDSLVNQTLDNIEIVVVNDGSPDNSQKIIDKYKKNYPKKISSYIKENGGVSSARNLGIEKAQGEYIAFIDGDDYVSLDMYEKMYNKAISNNFDIVVCDLNYIYEDLKNVQVSSNILKDTTDIKKVYVSMYPSVCNKIYKKELFDKKVEFKKGIYFEDVDFLYKIFPYIKSIGVLKDAFIQYVQREGSITHVFDNRLYDYVSNFNELIEFYKERNLYDEYKKELEYCYVRYLYATFVKRCANYNKKEYNKAVDIAIKNVKANFPKYRFNKYFYTSFKGLYLVLFNRFTSNILYRLLNH